MDKVHSRASAAEEKEQILRKLVGIVLDSTSPADDRLNAKQTLRRIGDDTIGDVLGRAVEESDNVTVIADAVEVLGFLPPTTGAKSALLRLLWHESAEVRQSALRALSRVGDHDVATVLLVVMSDSNNPSSIFDNTDGQLAQQARGAILRRAD